MLKIFTYGFIVIMLLLLSGCGAATSLFRLPSGEPDEFALRKKECDTLLGSTRKEVQDLFGHPQSIAHGIYTTYYIYEWRSTAAGVALVFVPIPIPVAGKALELHCILMLFDEDDVLYKCRMGTKFNKDTDSVYESCREVFGFPPE